MGLSERDLCEQRERLMALIALGVPAGEALLWHRAIFEQPDLTVIKTDFNHYLAKMTEQEALRIMMSLKTGFVMDKIEVLKKHFRWLYEIKSEIVIRRSQKKEEAHCRGDWRKKQFESIELWIHPESYESVSTDLLYKMMAHEMWHAKQQELALAYHEMSRQQLQRLLMMNKPATLDRSLLYYLNMRADGSGRVESVVYASQLVEAEAYYVNTRVVDRWLELVCMAIAAVG